MGKRSAGAICWTAAAAWAGACGGGNTSLEVMPQRIANAYCDKAYECCSQIELMDRQSEGPDKNACRLHNAVGFAVLRDKIEASVARGRVTYHGDILDACVKALATVHCEDLKSLHKPPALAACDIYLEPRVAVGGACTQDFECMRSTCQGEAEAKEGVCAGFAVDGQACESATCADTSYCDGKVCRPRKADGEPCRANFQCQSGGCNGIDQMQGIDGTCGPKGGPGTRCFLTTGCALAGAPGSPAAPAGIFCLIALAFLSLRTHRRTRPGR